MPDTGDDAHAGDAGDDAAAMPKLTPRQERFVTEYLVDLNGKQAALRTGYGPVGAQQHAARMLAMPQVRAAVDRGKAARRERTKVTQDQVISELMRMAFYDVGAIAGHRLEGPEDIATLPDAVRGAIAGWSWDKAGHFVVRLVPRTPSLDLLARHLGLLKDVRQHLGRDGQPVDPPALYTVLVR